MGSEKTKKKKTEPSTSSKKIQPFVEQRQSSTRGWNKKRGANNETPLKEDKNPSRATRKGSVRGRDGGEKVAVITAASENLELLTSSTKRRASFHSTMRFAKNPNDNNKTVLKRATSTKRRYEEKVNAGMGTRKHQGREEREDKE